MTTDARLSPEIQFVRLRVPEFEETFQKYLGEADGELGPFEAMSLLGQWVREHVSGPRDLEASRRAFDVIEQLILDEQFRLGDALAAEFIEAVWDLEDVAALMGPQTRIRAGHTSS